MKAWGEGIFIFTYEVKLLFCPFKCKDILIFYMLISNWKIEWGMLVFLILIV